MIQNSNTRPSVIEASGLRKSYGTLEVLKGLDLSLERGEVVALIGPSGSGKSTFIRCLNMMEIPTAGTIRFRQKSVGERFRDRGDEIGIGTLRRHVGMVFQHFNLFPHKTVLQNVTEGPIVVCRRPRREAEERAMDLLAQVGLAEKHSAYPNHLSGGQKQRVAIARALAMEPEVLLLDEVTSALDPELVGEVLSVIRGLADKGMTMAIVTHEMAFAADVASRVLFLDQGVIAETGTAEEVILNPQNPRLQGFVARFKN
ncbi:amino acid ABC transporter ATP-binding protein [Rhizobium rhizophilum]|uniref:Amino acid ABC transporter ATP-binding protein n=2 Tax=Rhizobium rhizophilum TaxID=1850373 RepID=A0ABY2QY29_9HYPH|nr:amino acid ABC transporter ATP-binding protein [Rhizobium rhizophilum]MBX9468041.1 amino acid ABC transporter ATP-binding protein [Rhizobium sp.]THV15875.1 amino acid ABC transporter ATP-binding protein [Rhizobium rhizophilum]